MCSRYAAIDIGTNSIRLLVCKVCGDEIFAIDKQIISTRLGQDVANTGLLQEHAIDRTAEGLRKFTREIQKFGADRVFCIATSAVRDAKNRDVFLKRVKDSLGLDIQVIQGDEEARLSFYGVLAGSDISGSSIVIDVGGGSTEIICSTDGKFDEKISIDIGAVRLKDRFKDMQEADEYILYNMEKMGNNLKHMSPDNCIGVGGTITSLAAIDLGLKVYDRNKVHGYGMKLKDIYDIYHHLSSMTYGSRKKVPGLQPERADIILTGTLILVKIMEYIGVDNIYVSDFDSLEGIIYSKSIKKT
ncbi:MAG: Ppx/GppA phosphatase family protein [Clostridia bacterium]|nr:Ppx/GppA phosphatase family protein [Clostridia bacterium]